MSENMSERATDEVKPPAKKLLETSPMSGIAVPIAIVLIGAFIIFGVTKMLSTGKDHRDLIGELNSKTFGNRWVAAYELSKFIASQKIPKEDIPWVIENLSQVYRESVDPRTRNFVVLALGSLKNPLCLEVLNLALTDQDPQVKFNAVVSLGNMPRGHKINWTAVQKMISQNKDPGLQQVALFTFASHSHEDTQENALELLNSEEKTLRYAAAVVLSRFKDKKALPILEEILSLTYDKAQIGELNGAQVEGLKMNVLENLEKTKWALTAPMVNKLEQNETNVRVATKAKQVLKILKN